MKKQILFSLVCALAIPAVAQAYTFDSDVPQNIKADMIQDMQFMGTIRGNTASGLHKQIFGPKVDGPTYVQWFTSRVKAVGMNDCGDPKAVACVIPFYNSSKMWLTQNYVKFNHPQIAKLMVMFHEARHTEAAHGYWPHDTCPDPFIDPQTGQEIKSIWTGASLAGEPACDSTPFGSYGSSMILLKNIQKFCTNCTAKVKMDAGIYADDQFKRIIDPTAIQQIKQDLYNDGQLRFWRWPGINFIRRAPRPMYRFAPATDGMFMQRAFIQQMIRNRALPRRYGR